MRGKKLDENKSDDLPIELVLREENLHGMLLLDALHRCVHSAGANPTRLRAIITRDFGAICASRGTSRTGYGKPK